MNRLAPFVAAALLAAAATSQAAGAQQRRLTVEAEMVRDATFTGVDRGRAKLVQKLRLQVALESDGVPSLTNPLDPDDGRRQLERAQRTQQKVQAALQRAPKTATPPPDPQAMAARAQALMAKCGQDRDCLMREASAISAAQVAGGHPQVQGRLEAYGAAVRGCEKQQAAAAREACIANARRAAGGGDEGNDDEVVETPYLLFTGTLACRLDAATLVDERIEGSFDDVQGVVPFTETRKADGRETEPGLCPQMWVVLDARNGRVWTRVLPLLRGVPGHWVRAEKGRQPRTGDGLQTVRWHEGQDWLDTRLANLNAAGSDRFEQALPGGKVEIRLRWSLAPL